MSRFPGKKLPPNWVYVPSRKEIRDLRSGLSADLRCVEFDGTGGRPSSVGITLGYLEQRVVDGAWCFYLRLWGVPKSAVEDRRGELARAALRAIGQSVARCLAVPAAAVVKPTQLHLVFEVGPNGAISKCYTKPVGMFSFSSGCWWANPRPAQPRTVADPPRREKRER